MSNAAAQRKRQRQPLAERGLARLTLDMTMEERDQLRLAAWRRNTTMRELIMSLLRKEVLTEELRQEVLTQRT